VVGCAVDTAGRRGPTNSAGRTWAARAWWMTDDEAAGAVLVQEPPAKAVLANPAETVSSRSPKGGGTWSLFTPPAPDTSATLRYEPMVPASTLCRSYGYDLPAAPGRRPGVRAGRIKIMLQIQNLTTTGLPRTNAGRSGRCGRNDRRSARPAGGGDAPWSSPDTLAHPLRLRRPRGTALRHHAGPASAAPRPAAVSAYTSGTPAISPCSAWVAWRLSRRGRWGRSAGPATACCGPASCSARPPSWPCGRFLQRVHRPNRRPTGSSRPARTGLFRPPAPPRAGRRGWSAWP